MRFQVLLYYPCIFVRNTFDTCLIAVLFVYLFVCLLIWLLMADKL